MAVQTLSIDALMRQLREAKATYGGDVPVYTYHDGRLTGTLALDGPIEIVHTSVYPNGGHPVMMLGYPDHEVFDDLKQLRSNNHSDDLDADKE